MGCPRDQAINNPNSESVKCRVFQSRPVQFTFDRLYCHSPILGLELARGGNSELLGASKSLRPMGFSRDEAINQPNAESQTSHSSAVRVAVRVRPLLHFEKAQKQGECTRVLPPPNELQIAVGPIGDGGSGCGGRGEGKSFTFDATFSTRASQNSLYEECITPLVEGEVFGCCFFTFLYEFFYGSCWKEP